MSTPFQGSCDHLERMKPTIPHHQHVRAETAQQTQSSDTLRALAWPKARIDDGMRSAFNEIDTLNLRKCSLSTRSSVSPKCPCILRGIRNVFDGPINGHQTQAKQEGPLGLTCRHGFTNGMEERNKRFRSQLIPPVGQCGVSRQLVTGVWPEKT